MTMQSTKRKGFIVTAVFKNLLMIQIMAIIAATLGSMVDGIVIGNFLGSEAMAAFGLVMPIVIILAAVSGVFSSGAQALCGKFMGHGDDQAVNRVFSVTCVALVTLSGVLVVLCIVLVGPLATVLGATGGLKPLAQSYLLGYAIGIPAVVVTSTLTSFMQLDGDAPRSFFAILAMTGTNIVLDLLNALVFNGGMLGMALATAISYYVSLVVLLLHFRKPEASIRLQLKGMRMKDLRDVLAIGMPNAVGRICTTLRSLFLNRLLLIIAGSTAVAALAVQNSLGSLIGAVSIGIGMTTLLLSSVILGEEDTRSLSDLMNYAVKWGAIMTAGIAVLVFFLADVLAAMFGTGDPEALALAGRVIRFYALSLPFNTINVVFMNYFQAADNKWMANAVSVLDNVAYMALLAIVLSPMFGTDGVWISFLLAELLMLVTLYLIALRHGRAMPKKMEHFLLLKSDFGVPEEQRLSLTVNSMEEVLQLSMDIEEFCNKFQVDTRRKMLLSLCVEEMAGNIVRHGFEPGKNHMVDIRVVYKDGLLLLHMRDNCKPFDPGNQSRIFNPEDPCANIGIRMVASMAKEMEYRNSLNLNNLSITI